MELHPHVSGLNKYADLLSDIDRGYAIEMVDQVYDRNGTDVPLEVALINALGYVNGFVRRTIHRAMGPTRLTHSQHQSHKRDHCKEPRLDVSDYAFPDLV